MHQSRTISVSINRPWRSVYDAIRRPDDFPRWASGLSSSRLEQDGEQGKAQGREGPIRIRFTADNPFGVMDHWVDPGSGGEIYVAMRVIANDGGAEVMLFWLRQPGVSDAKFAADAEWVERDLAALQALLAA